MSQLYSFRNEARDIYRNSRHMVELLVKAGQVKPDGVETTVDPSVKTIMHRV